MIPIFSSEQKFTINGEDNKVLEKVLQLALEICGWKEIKAFYEDPNGLVFCAYSTGTGAEGTTIEYPFKATPAILVEHINQYLDKLSDEAILRLAGEAPDNDGDVILGWEIFHPLWYGENKINNYKLSAILAVRPCWITYGK